MRQSLLVTLAALCWSACDGGKQNEPPRPAPSSDRPATASGDDEAVAKAILAATTAARGEELPGDAANTAAMTHDEAIASLARLRKSACRCRSLDCAQDSLATFRRAHDVLSHRTDAGPLAVGEARRIEADSKQVTRCLIKSGIPAKELVQIFRSASMPAR